MGLPGPLFLPVSACSICPMSTFLTIERRLALVIAGIALLVLYLTFQVPEPSTFMPVGPRLFPFALGGAMLLSALLLFILPPRQPLATNVEQAVAEHTDAAAVEGVGEAEGDEQLEWQRLLGLMSLTLVYVLAFSLLGFVLSTAPFIVAASRILGSRNLVRDIIVGVVVASGIYFLFTELLQVGLPPIPFLEI